MADSIIQKVRRGWNAFTSQDTNPVTANPTYTMGSYMSSGVRPDRSYTLVSSSSTVTTPIYTRIAIDAASIDVRHTRVDAADRFESDINSALNQCLVLEANIDQAATAFRQDLFETMFEHGVVAVVPVDTTHDPDDTSAYDIQTLRVGEIVGWFPKHVRVKLYNDNVGRHEELILPKSLVAIIHNPLYSVMNAQNSTLKRLVRKMNLLDSVDERVGSGKMDMIIQLPYSVKTDVKREQVETRKRDIEFQLKESPYGIVYLDGTEKVTQLNRPIDNQLQNQISELTKQLHYQLGLTEEVFNGTANEATMLNYINRTIEPIMNAMVEEFRRKFLTKTARTQRQTIQYFRDPFTLVAVTSIADIADKLSRNEIVTPNEMRSVLGLKPSTAAKSDELSNRNMPSDNSSEVPPPEGAPLGEADNEYDLGYEDGFADGSAEVSE